MSSGFDGCTADAGVLWAWRKMEREGGGSSISSLARELDCSRKHLMARFRDQIGLPPKSIAGLLRFNRALAMIGAARKPDLARIAAAAGYFDQPHFNRDFATLAGITPGEFLRARLGRRRRRRRLNASGNIRTRYAPFSAAHWRRINQERSLMSKPGNRPNLFPALKYQNAKQAIYLLVNAFGFEKSAVHAGDGDMVAT